MLEALQKDVAEIRELVFHPTPANYQQINAKLVSLSGFLGQMTESEKVSLLADKDARDFLGRLPAEMAHLRRLMEAPLHFYAGLVAIRAKYFGSYERTGSFRSLEPDPSGKTLIHL